MQSKSTSVERAVCPLSTVHCKIAPLASWPHFGTSNFSIALHIAYLVATQRFHSDTNEEINTRNDHCNSRRSNYRSARRFHLICPITMEVMEFPLMTRTGLNYDRHAILSWLEENGSCPLTRSRMQPCDLISNRKLRHDIARWRVENGLTDGGYEDQEVEASWESSSPSKFFVIHVTNEQQQRISNHYYNGNGKDSLLSLQRRAREMAREQQESNPSSDRQARLPVLRRRATADQRNRRNVLRRVLDAAFHNIDD